MKHNVEFKSFEPDERMRHLIEEHVPATRSKECVSMLGKEIMYFYQPDEALKVEDVTPDPEVITPEEEVATQELRDCVSASLRDMPGDWQRVHSETQPAGCMKQSLERAIALQRRNHGLPVNKEC